MTTPKYLWLDLETTGLDPVTDEILECAVVVTDAQLNEIGDPFVMVLSCDDDVRAEVDPFVEDMHTRNGLWDECDRSTLDVDDLSFRLRRFIEAHEWAEGKPILAGATVHFDRSFLEEQTSTVYLLHHRHLDVSSLKLAHLDACGIPFAKAEAHRALADVRESLLQARAIYQKLRWS